MATISLPSEPAFKSIKARYRSATKMDMSPYTYNQQVYAWAGKLKVVDFELPPMTQTQADDWLAFFKNLNGYENTFQVNLVKAYPNETTATAVNMRLADPEQVWNVDLPLIYGITFSAIEAK